MIFIHNLFMADVIKLKKGLDIKLNGEAEKAYRDASTPETIALVPDDFYGVVPKPMLKPGDAVKVGTVVFVDKRHPDLKVVSPVSGEVAAINRGDRRKILEIVIKNDGKMTAETLKPVSGAASAEDVKQLLSDAGMFAFFKQRPYDVAIDPADTPKAIFVSTFDNAPLAPDYDFIFADEVKNIQSAIDVLGKIAPVYVGVSKKSGIFKSLKNANVAVFDGKYPACNVGVQINHTNPINKGEIVWTIGLQELAYIGRYANGKLDFSKSVAITGPEVKTPSYYKLVLGQPLAAIVKNNEIDSDPVRVVAGNPLSGHQIETESWLPPFCNQITILRDGSDIHEFIGWMMPRFDKFSLNRSFLTKFFTTINPDKTFNADTRIMGGHRNMIMSGEYDKVFPMDIYPEYLIKAIIAGNIDKMEALGIYEVAPEDFAAAEFACSSKMELQRIVREGLDMLRKEMS